MIASVQELGNITDPTEQTTQLRNFIDTLESVEDVSTVLRQGGISEELARTALGQSRNFADGPMSILWTKKVERLCSFFEFLILLLLGCYVTNSTVYSFTVIPALYVFKNCPAGLC